MSEISVPEPYLFPRTHVRGHHVRCDFQFSICKSMNKSCSDVYIGVWQHTYTHYVHYRAILDVSNASQYLKLFPTVVGLQLSTKLWVLKKNL